MATYSVPQMQSLADYYSGVYSVPPAITRAVVGAESSWIPTARNPGSTATGLGQVLASTAARPGYGVTPLADRTDPAQSLNFVTQYLSALRNQFGSWTAALQRYSGQTGTPYAGNPAVQQALADVGETGLGTTGSVTPISGFYRPVSGGLLDGLRGLFRPPAGATDFDPSTGTYTNPDGDIVNPDGSVTPYGRGLMGLLEHYGINASAVVVGILFIALGAYFLVKRGF